MSMQKIAPFLGWMIVLGGCSFENDYEDSADLPSDSSLAVDDSSLAAIAEGQRVFRFETFNNESFWTDKAKMHEVIEQSVSPAMALKVGLKVDADAIPADIASAIKSGKVDLENPATTVTLLKLNAIVGLKGTVQTVEGKEKLVRLGITCSLCHSTVDDSFSPGIGRRKDGWPNRDLNVGAIIALSPAMTSEQKSVYNSWARANTIRVTTSTARAHRW